MIYYTADKRLFRKDLDKVSGVVRAGLIVVGLMIGISMGFWVAVRTLPVPHTIVEYHYRTP